MKCPAGFIALLLLSALAACSTRAPHPSGDDSPTNWTESSVIRVVSVWQEQLRQYIEREGNGDPAALSHMTAFRSRDVLRPARITFGVLDVDTDLPGRNGWDVQGLLVGTHPDSVHPWYVFVVGIVRRSDYRPWMLQDIRLVGLGRKGANLTWEMSVADPGGLQRYREAFAGSGSVRFPAESDRFSMTVAGDRIRVEEARSGADWVLTLHDSDPALRDKALIPVRSGTVKGNSER